MNKILSCLILLLLFSCGTRDKTSVLMNEVINSLPHEDSIHVCNLQENAAYRPSNESWKDSTSIRYYIDYPPAKDKEGNVIVDYFNDGDKMYIKTKTKIAADEWAFAVLKDVHEVDKKEKANAIITFKFLEDEGRGANLALSSFPPAKGQYGKSTIRMDLADMYDYIKARDKAKYTYYTVILHEFGHLIGGLMHDSEFSVTDPTKVYSELQIDDIAGARVNIGNFDNFIYEGITYTFIPNNKKNYNVTDNFTKNELLSKCTYPKYEIGHFLAKNTIDALQFIRTYYGVPIKINSSYRDINCNKISGGAKFSQHQFRNAIDWRFIGKKAQSTELKFINDIVNQKGPFRELLNYKIRGFGTYPSGANHIDCRAVKIGNRRYGLVQYIIWGDFNKKGSFYNPIKEFEDYD